MIDPGRQRSAGESARSLRLLTAGVAAGFGVLGWLGAQVATLALLGHGHLDASGHGFRHVHGYATPTALAAAAMVAACLLALSLLPGTGPRADGARTRPSLLVGVAAPAAAFVALEGFDALITGAEVAHAGRALAVGVACQALFGLGAAYLAATCRDRALSPTPAGAPVGLPAPRRSLPRPGHRVATCSAWLTGPAGSRAPPPLATL
ncbi:MAG: hypothetical protein ACT4QF_04995 [Sporichthyaceae bacterium]